MQWVVFEQSEASKAYYWSATAEKKQKLVDNLRQFTTEFDIRVYT